MNDSFKKTTQLLPCSLLLKSTTVQNALSRNSSSSSVHFCNSRTKARSEAALGPLIALTHEPLSPDLAAPVSRLDSCTEPCLLPQWGSSSPKDAKKTTQVRHISITELIWGEPLVIGHREGSYVMRTKCADMNRSYSVSAAVVVFLFVFFRLFVHVVSSFHQSENAMTSWPSRCILFICIEWPTACTCWLVDLSYMKALYKIDHIGISDLL